jgi:GST-like protein
MRIEVPSSNDCGTFAHRWTNAKLTDHQGMAYLSAVASRASSFLRAQCSSARAFASQTSQSTAQANDVTLYSAKSTFPAFNGWKLTILLEEMKEAGALQSFTVRELDLDALEHKSDWFLKINPNGRIPAVIDHQRNDLALFESGAIMIYLAEQYKCFIPPQEDVEGRMAVLQWLCFQLSGVGPMQGQAHAFTRYVPERIDYAISRYQNETTRLYQVLEEKLSRDEYVAGSAYSIADMALFPWCKYHEWAGVSIDGMPSLQRWIEQLDARPAVQKGLAYNKKDIRRMLAEADDIRGKVAATTLDQTNGPASRL